MPGAAGAGRKKPGPGQDDLAVDVVLKVLARLVADAHRLHAAVALDGLDDALVDVLLQSDAVDGLDVAAARGVDQVAQVAEVVLEDVDRAQPAFSARVHWRRRRGSNSSGSPSCGRSSGTRAPRVVAATMAPVSS